MKKQLYNHKAEQKLADIINDVRSHIQMSMPPEFFRETIASLKEDLFSSQGLYVGDKELKQAIDTFNGFPSAGFAQNCPAMAFRIAELLFLANQQGVLYQPMLVHPAEIGITSLLKLHPVIQVMKEQFPHRKITYNLFEPGYSLSNGETISFAEERTVRDGETRLLSLHAVHLNSTGLKTKPHRAFALTTGSLNGPYARQYAESRDYVLKEFSDRVLRARQSSAR